jgi:hypothetical protein
MHSFLLYNPEITHAKEVLLPAGYGDEGIRK